MSKRMSYLLNLHSWGQADELVYRSLVVPLLTQQRTEITLLNAEDGVVGEERLAH